MLLPTAELTRQHRDEVATAMDQLRARSDGTGLYDTVLAAYLAARDQYRAGVPNHVVVFTDGHNESDPGSMTIAQLTERLVAARDPNRPVGLTVIAFGDKPYADELTKALEPVDGYVSQPSTADAVGEVFLHVAAGGVHD